ncbi:unnamed protein product [Pedinophyceae sp. YPF-701]|nr:unnamed protein product [Pedinophyceae sp. YPF-701]
MSDEKAVGPIVESSMVSFVMGGCVGAATKFLAKTTAIFIGVLFLGLQLAAYAGVIEVNYSKLWGKVERAVDQTGDGKFDEKDVEVLKRKFMQFASTGVPNAAGFGAGFMAAIKLL